MALLRWRSRATIEAGRIEAVLDGQVRLEDGSLLPFRRELVGFNTPHVGGYAVVVGGAAVEFQSEAPFLKSYERIVTP